MMRQENQVKSKNRRKIIARPLVQLYSTSHRDLHSHRMTQIIRALMQVMPSEIGSKARKTSTTASLLSTLAIKSSPSFTVCAVNAAAAVPQTREGQPAAVER